MNPFKQLVLHFDQDWKLFLGQPELRLFHVETDANLRTIFVKLLRAYEQHPENQRPYFICEDEAQNLNGWLEKLVAKLRADYGALTAGLAEEGIQLVPLPDAMARPDDVHLFLQWLASALSKRFKGALLVLCPQKVYPTEIWRQLVSHLSSQLPSFFKLVAAEQTRDLASLEKPPAGQRHRTVFAMDDAVMQAFMDGEATVALERAAKANPMNPPWTPDLVVAFQRDLMAANKAVGHSDWTEAVRNYEEALRLCQQHNLVTEEVGVLLGLGNCYLGWEKPTEAIGCYKEGVALAEKLENPGLACQLRMAWGSALFQTQVLKQATEVYEQAGADAEAAGVPVLRIEALRMAGTCHHLRGDSDGTLRCWQAAIDSGIPLPVEARKQSSIDLVGRALIKRNRELGLHAQARSLEQLLGFA